MMLGQSAVGGRIGLSALVLSSLLVVSACGVHDASEDDSASTTSPEEGLGSVTGASESVDQTASAVAPDTSEGDPPATADDSATGAVAPGASAGDDETEVPIAQYASFGTQVATVGDSWMHNTLFTGSAISGALKRAGLRLDNYAAQGVTLLPPGNLFGTPVSTQIERSVIGWRGQSQYKTVIATGGGNDVILNAPLERSCSASSAESPQFSQCLAKLNEIFAKWDALWAKMGEAGVADVVYVSYSNQAGSAPVANDYSNQKMAELCAKYDGQSTSIRCTFIDGNDYVNSKLDLILDGIHPSRSINDRIAKGIISAIDSRAIAR